MKKQIVSAVEFFQHISSLRQSAAMSREKIHIEIFKRIDLMMQDDLQRVDQIEAYERIKKDRIERLRNADDNLEKAINTECIRC